MKLVKNVDGIAALTAGRFVDNIAKFVQFMNDAGLEHILYNTKALDTTVDTVDTVGTVDTVKSEIYGKKIVMTGFRDKELTEKLKKMGVIVSDNVSKNIFIVLVKVKDEDTTKANQARENNIPIMLVDDFIKKYNL